MRQATSRFGSRRWRLAVLALGTGATLYVLICAGCAACQRRLIYFPTELDSAQVDQFARSAGLERWTNPSGQPVGMKRLVSGQPAKGQVLLLYGNGSCATGCAHYADTIQSVAPFDVFIVEYPGYADRPGKPTEQSLDDSAAEGFRLLATRGPVYLVGESLGTGVASYLAGAHPENVAGIVLLAPYSSLADVAQFHMPYLPVRLLLRDRFPSDKYLRTYRGPVAMLVAGEDQVVPLKFGRRLYEGYSGPKRLWEFPKGDHGTVMTQPPEIWREIFNFLQERRSGDEHD